MPPPDNALNPKDDFYFAFNNSATGLPLAAGQTLTVRVYPAQQQHGRPLRAAPQRDP